LSRDTKLTKRFDPYARRSHETQEVWFARLLDCPILGPEPIETIASISGADEELLRIYRIAITKAGWRPFGVSEPVPDDVPQPVESPHDEYF
jgi:hypothetical protein